MNVRRAVVVAALWRVRVGGGGAGGGWFEQPAPAEGRAYRRGGGAKSGMVRQVGARGGARLRGVERPFLHISLFPNGSKAIGRGVR